MWPFLQSVLGGLVLSVTMAVGLIRETQSLEMILELTIPSTQPGGGGMALPVQHADLVLIRVAAIVSCLPLSSFCFCFRIVLASV